MADSQIIFFTSPRRSGHPMQTILARLIEKNAILSVGRTGRIAFRCSCRRGRFRMFPFPPHVSGFLRAPQNRPLPAGEIPAFKSCPCFIQLRQCRRRSPFTRTSSASRARFGSRRYIRQWSYTRASESRGKPTSKQSLVFDPCFTALVLVVHKQTGYWQFRSERK